MKLWAGRFQKETDTMVNDFNSSITFDARMYEEDIRGSMAHAAMLGRQGIIAPEEAEKIIVKAREAMQAEKNAAIAELQASVADIACAAMTRVVQEDFTDADHRRLIEKSLEEIGTLNA